MISAELLRALSVQNALFRMQSVLLTCRFHIHYIASLFLLPYSIFVFFKKIFSSKLLHPYQRWSIKHGSARRTETAWIHFEMIKLPLLSFPSHWTVKASITVLLIFVPFWWLTAVESTLCKSEQKQKRVCCTTFFTWQIARKVLC